MGMSARRALGLLVFSKRFEGTIHSTRKKKKKKQKQKKKKKKKGIQKKPREFTDAVLATYIHYTPTYSA